MEGVEGWMKGQTVRQTGRQTDRYLHVQHQQAKFSSVPSPLVSVSVSSHQVQSNQVKSNQYIKVRHIISIKDVEDVKDVKHLRSEIDHITSYHEKKEEK